MARPAQQPRGNDPDKAPPRARFGYIAGYSTVDNTRLEALAAVPPKEGGLTDREFRVFQWYVGATPGPDQPVMKTTAQIAKRLGTSPDALGRIVRKLVKRRLLFFVEEFGRQRFYKVSPYFASQQDAFEQRTTIKSYNPPDIPGLPGNPGFVKGESA
ncbi:MarR family transcriptional regulator [Streptomyces sp. NPDC051173]|uniref:MarR family transcriptional regulator n=1 Tax=Streptomyces sp. NPDC051173 TaxID=3155164 RepID=UPI00344BF5A2